MPGTRRAIAATCGGVRVCSVSVPNGREPGYEHYAYKLAWLAALKTTIADDAALFGGGLGLDSLDALQLAMAIEDKLGAVIPAGDEARPIFKSVRSIAEHVAKVRSA